jgi:hypothetical protein
MRFEGTQQHGVTPSWGANEITNASPPPPSSIPYHHFWFCLCPVVTKHHSRRPRDDYIRTILSPNSWGGAIELTILAAHYGTEIASIDVETGRIDRFGVGGSGDVAPAESRALLIYSGIHYDAAVLAPEPGAPREFCASVVLAVGAEGECMLDALRALATKLRAKRAYTNTATFDLKCEVREVVPCHFLVANVRSGLTERTHVPVLGLRRGTQRREGGPRACSRDGAREVWRILGYPLYAKRIYVFCTKDCKYCQTRYLSCFSNNTA